jgi:tRNA (mo5U34)-methyltransferase
MDRMDAKALIDQASWYHGWEILPGVVTPGIMRLDPDNHLTGLGVPSDLHGLRALDIGSYDGPFAFAMEKRGAIVTAVDIQDPDHTGFNTAQKLLESKVRYVRSSVYDLSKHLETFDIILFLGVYYHLKHPILAFEEIERVSHEGTQLFVEGECYLNYAEDLNGNPVATSTLAYSDIPICLAYPGRYKGTSNWFVPNVACLKGWIACGGFALQSYKLLTVNQQRFIGHAVRSPQPLPFMAARDQGGTVEHPLL